jgi:hypothetical protein
VPEHCPRMLSRLGVASAGIDNVTGARAARQGSKVVSARIGLDQAGPGSGAVRAGAVLDAAAAGTGKWEAS